MLSRPQSIADVAQRLVAKVARDHGANAVAHDILMATPHFVSDFRHEIIRVGLAFSQIEEAPALTGNTAVDTWFGGLGEDLARRLGVDPPAWTQAAERFLAQPFHFGGVNVRDEIMAETPVAWARRNLYCGNAFPLNGPR